MKEGEVLTIYERIKARRKELNLSADDVAEALNISRATVYRYESSDIEKLPITVIEPLSKVLKIPPGQLMGWDQLESDIRKEQSFENYLKSLGYTVTIKKIGESKIGYTEENNNPDGTIVGQSRIPNDEYFEVVLTKSGKTATYTDNEFKAFQKACQDSVDYQFWRKNN